MCWRLWGGVGVGVLYEMPRSSAADTRLCVLGAGGWNTQSPWGMGRQAQPAAYPPTTSFSQPTASSHHHQKFHTIFHKAFNFYLRDWVSSRLGLDCLSGWLPTGSFLGGLCEERSTLSSVDLCLLKDGHKDRGHWALLLPNPTPKDTRAIGGKGHCH